MIAMKYPFESESILQFKYEMNVNGKIPFLDVMVKMEDGVIKTNVYKKILTLDNALILIATVARGIRIV